MAAMENMSDNLTMEKLEEDMTICCICTEVYTDPKVLPCIHTFCMKCLQQTGLKTNKEPGDEMPCPICRLKFKIPAEGFHGLPKNYFLERLIHVSRVSYPSAVSRALCSVCLEENNEQEGKETPTADKYCIDCKYKLCEECSSEHRKFKLTKNHKLMPIDEHSVDQNVMTDLASMVCDVHEQNLLNVYCADCKTVVCAICFIEEHNNHKGSHVNKCVDVFRSQIQHNTEAINVCIAEAQVKKTEIMKVKEKMQQMVESLECDVEKRKDEIKQLTDKHASILLQSLCYERKSRLKEIQMASDDIDGDLSNLESYNSYCQGIMDKGSASDICRAVSDLSVRAVELQQQCRPTTERGIQDFKFCFRQSELEEFIEDAGGNLLGEIEEESDSTLNKRSKQSLLMEQNIKNDLMKKKIEIERTEKESLRLANVQLRNNVAKEVQVNKTLTEKLRNEKANYGTHLARLKQTLDNNKTAINALQTNNRKLKLKFDGEKTNNNSLQTSNYELVEELHMYKATVKTLEINVDKLRKELEITKTEKLRYRRYPVLVQTIRTKAAEEGKKWIRGLTILDKELFVVSGESSEIEIYDSLRFNFRGRWNLKEIVDPMDIGSCNRNKCLYIFNYRCFLGQSHEILRVDPNGKLIKNWSTGDDWGHGLSVTYESNVILTVFNKDKLNEYSPAGQLIREINLSSDAGIRRPWYAIDLTNGHFLVSHGCYDDDMHRVCIVSVDGKLKKSFGGKPGFTIGQMNRPGYLSIVGNGFMMVADRENRRLLLSDSDLKFKSEILSKDGKHGIRYPERILLDHSNGRLFISDNESNNQRISVFDEIIKCQKLQ